MTRAECETCDSKDNEGHSGCNLAHRNSSMRRSRRRRLHAISLAMVAIAAIAIALIPAQHTEATETKEGGGCGAPTGCHDNNGLKAPSPSLMTVSGFPAGTYVPGFAYTITIQVVDSLAGGKNSFDLLTTAGTLTSSDSNVETNIPPSGYSAEASQNDSAATKTATTWTLVWTAPASGSVTIDVWAVVGDGTTGTKDPFDHETFVYSGTIPEFPILVVPIIGMLAVVAIASRFLKR